jgi:hypothetical protein
VEQLLKVDHNLLFMMDSCGSLPLSYVQEEDYDEWMNFFHSKENMLWPAQPSSDVPNPPPLALLPSNSRPVHDPIFIEMLASGRMTPDEVTILNGNDTDDSESDGGTYSELDDDDDDSKTESEEEDDEANFTFEDFYPGNGSYGNLSSVGYALDCSESKNECDIIVAKDSGTTKTQWNHVRDSLCEREIFASIPQPNCPESETIVAATMKSVVNLSALDTAKDHANIDVAKFADIVGGGINSKNYDTRSVPTTITFTPENDHEHFPQIGLKKNCGINYCTPEYEDGLLYGSC